MDLYETLGVARDATKDAVKKAFRRKAKEAHPDAGGDPEQFHAIELAHRVLTDDEKRQKYDQTGTLDDKPDTIDAQALSVISGLVERFLDDDAALKKDLAAELRKSINADIAMAKRSKQDGEAYVKRAEKMRDRFGGKTKQRVVAMIARRIDQAKAAVEGLDRQIEVRQHALTLIDDLSFEADKPAEDPYAHYRAGVADMLRNTAERDFFYGFGRSQT